MSQSITTYILIPIRIVSSHKVNKIGYQCSKTGKFSVRIAENEYKHSFELNNIIIFDYKIEKLKLDTKDDWQFLSIDFADDLEENVAKKFLDDFIISSSVFFSSKDNDQWNGCLFVEADWSKFFFIKNNNEKIEKNEDGVMMAKSYVCMTDTVYSAIDKNILLTSNNISLLKQPTFLDFIFFDGMKANSLKSKYLYWFIILEELEKRKEFNELFNSFFSNEEIDQIIKNSALERKKTDKLKQIIKDRQITQEGRAEKMFIILKKIGITKIESNSQSTVIDKRVCKQLIEERNKIAHKGNNVDTDLLYKILNPLSLKVLQYLNEKQ